MDYRFNNFGPYKASYTTEKDVEEILAFIESKERELVASKSTAVYRRRDEVLVPTISNGLGFKIERHAANEEEYKALGNKEKRIMGFTGAYILGVDDNGVQSRVPTEMAKGLHTRLHEVAEVGTTLVIPPFDLANTDGNLPKRCFFKLLIAATTLNLFRLAGSEVGGQQIKFDTVTANVQNRVEMRTVMNWLTNAPLAWQMIERPSVQLAQISSETTIDAEDYNSRDKFFYELVTSSLPGSAKYVLDCMKSHRLPSDHEFDKHIAHIDFDISDEIVQFFHAVKSAGKYFKDNAESGLTDVRRRLHVPELPQVSSLAHASGYQTPARQPMSGGSISQLRRSAVVAAAYK